jgi:hypothetical protein
MIPVKPPAASASNSTAGSQSLESRCLRCSGGVLMITFGEYLEAMILFSQNNLP